MSRKSERRARRQAVNELLARHEPPSKLDELDHRGVVPNTEPAAVTVEPAQPAPLPQLPEQSGPPATENTAELAAHHR